MQQDLTAVRPGRNTLDEPPRDLSREIAWRYYARWCDCKIASDLRLPVRVIERFRSERFLIAN